MVLAGTKRAAEDKKKSKKETFAVSSAPKVDAEYEKLLAEVNIAY